jgi:hypothetical protein
MAERIGRLANEVVESFQSDDPARRIARLQQVEGEILFGMLPVVGWLERWRPAGTAELVKARLADTLREAVCCAGLDIPLYAGGEPARVAGEPDLGVLRTAALAAGSKLLAASLRDLADTIEAEDRQRAPAVPTIWSHGDRAYSRDGTTSYCVSEEEDSILQAFLEAGKAMDTPTLEDKSGSTNVPRAIKRLCQRYSGVFADAIRMTGGGGKRGPSTVPGMSSGKSGRHSSVGVRF